MLNVYLVNVSTRYAHNVVPRSMVVQKLDFPLFGIFPKINCCNKIKGS